LALLGSRLIFHVSRIRVNSVFQECKDKGKQGVSEGILLVTKGRTYELDSLLKNRQLNERYSSVNSRAEQMLDCLEENGQQRIEKWKTQNVKKRNTQEKRSYKVWNGVWKETVNELGARRN
jgi:hypothetical protein